MRRQQQFGLILAGVVAAAAFAAACDETVEATKVTPGADATVDAPVTPTGDGGDGATPLGDAGGDAAPDPVARGKYLVDTLAACGDCHTPRKPDGSPDLTKYLSGVECFAGVDQSDAGTPDAGGDGGDAGDASAVDAGPAPPGCLHARNLTNDPTGLQNRTEQEIRDMFQHGLRPNGQALSPVMPYWEYANMTDADARAIVAYLRTVPGISHALPPNQPPWSLITTPVPALDLTTVPNAPAGNDSAARGRYLATAVSSCIDCHTRETSPGSGILDGTKWFAGSHIYPAAQMGLPSPPFPAVIYSANLTPHATGLAAYSAAEIVAALKQGKDRDGGNVCPPMPVGPHGPFGGMADSDALDIATYLQTLAPIDLARPADCVAP